MSTDQESPPAQNETITTATNKPETDDSKTLKQDSEITSKNSPPKDALSQSTATNKPEETADDSKALKQDSESDPSAKDIPQAETETTSKNSKTTEDAEALKQGSATDADPHRPEKTPSEDQTTSKDTSPTKNDSTQTTAANKQETDDTKSTQPDSAAGADPHVQETVSTHSSPPKNSSTQITAIRKPETDDTQAREKDSATDADPHVQPVKNESTSKDSSPPNQATATHEPETHENKILAAELPGDADPHPPVQEISPADDETTSKKSSPDHKMAGVNDPETQAAETLEKDSINDADPRPKKIECRRWKKLKNLLSLITGKPSQSKSSVGGQRTKDEVPAGGGDEKQVLSKLIQADLNDIATGAKKLGQYKDQLNKDHDEASKVFENLKEHGKKEDLHELRKDMMKLKLHVPRHKVDEDKKDPHKNLRFTSKTKQSISDQEVLNKMPQLHNSDVLKRSMEFKDFEVRYNELTCQSKLCLLCLSVFPENAIIKKRLMVHWWVAEGFASEDEANKCFAQLLEKGFIEPVNKNRSLSVGSYKMHPFNRSALVMLTEKAKFFNFGARGEPTQNFLETFQACLVGKGLISFEDLKNNKLKVDDLEKLHLLINVDEHILEFKPDWFAMMRNLNFLYLGRWKALATDHIEVEDTKFLRGLGKMSCVKFLSLQGVSNIIDLPESILQLTNLKILDLRACYNLETIPERIGSLKSLTHLDMSECYLLDHMPKSLSQLEELRVLKGFVVGSKEEKKSECTLDDLEILGNLTKLCIYTGSKEFPNDQHVAALGKLKKLSKLTIIWGGSALQATTANNTAENTTPEKQSSNGCRLPPTLKKLDLKCFPKSTAPNWLSLNNLQGLKKLYIRGGKLSDLGQYQDIDDCNLAWPVKKETWKVEVLRLKYLSEIEMEWRQLQELFPDLVYLEQVSCPKLTLFPCDANGVWIDMISSKQSSGNVP